MKFKIHRGTQEIGGSCVEVWTDTTRILVDFGLPLVNNDGSQFEMKDYEGYGASDLVEAGVLPNIQGLYGDGEDPIDAVVISHAHPDHYGLLSYISSSVPFYMGRPTHRIIDLSNMFTPQQVDIENVNYFEKEKPFRIGDISITPYWMDHSAFDAFAFLIEADGKSIFYSGDLRAHGRKRKVFERFKKIAPKGVDHLLLEGTKLDMGDERFKTEEEIENDLVELFKEPYKINMVHASGQNIDRLVSIFKACLKAEKTFVVDVYVAKVLKELSEFAKLPFPSDDFENIKVIFPYFTSRRLSNQGNEAVLYQFKKYKVTKEEIGQDPSQYVMVVRPSMQKDLEHIDGIDGGNLIYSMWRGYLEKSNTSEFIDYLKDRGFSVHILHTSGHADPNTLKELVDALQPKNIVPIHTFEGDNYSKVFDEPVIRLSDGEVKEIE